jgi:tRNA pseudouridine32 synthase/23S rRNA pseudouridine746 synthase
MFSIIDETSDYWLINKPAGMSCHCDDDTPGVFELLKQQTDAKHIYPVHRLDKITSGLLLVAKSSASAELLNQQFRHHRIEKQYLALSSVKPKKKQGWVIGDMEKARRGQWKLNRSKINPAASYFYSKALPGGQRLFLVKPYTGKTHQIRVALKSVGSPIYGDPLYGHNPEADRAYLHAFRIGFELEGECRHYEVMPTGQQVTTDWEALIAESWPMTRLDFPVYPPRR